MLNDRERVAVESIDWAGALPALRIARAARMALRPTALFVALLLVGFIFAGGYVYDAVTGRVVVTADYEHFRHLSRADYGKYMEDGDKRVTKALRNSFETFYIDPAELEKAIQSPDRTAQLRKRMLERVEEEIAHTYASNLLNEQTKAKFVAGKQRQRADLIRRLDSLHNRGAFEAAAAIKVRLLRRLVSATLARRTGLVEWHVNGSASRGSMIGTLQELVVAFPRWLIAEHPWLIVSHLLVSIFGFALFGGALSRLTALHATKDERLPATRALAFAGRKFVWFFVTPWMPILLAGTLAGGIVLGGLALLNVPWLGLLGAVLYGLALVVAILIVFLMAVYACGAPLLYPALAVEGTDGFDANSRALGYVVARPWRWLGYNAVAVVIGLIACGLFAAVVCLATTLTDKLVGLGVVAEHADGLDRFEAIDADTPLDWPLAGTAAVIHFWRCVATGLMLAYVTAFFFSAQTWVYLLLRHSVDGTEPNDVYIDDAETRTAIEEAADELAEADVQTDASA